MRMDSPLLFTNELMAGLGPRKAASMAPAFSASMAEGPALKTWVDSLVPPRFLAKMPSFTPIRAGAWVTLGK